MRDGWKLLEAAMMREETYEQWDAYEQAEAERKQRLAEGQVTVEQLTRPKRKRKRQRKGV